jgi:GGDEF domain-containing protein
MPEQQQGGWTRFFKKQQLAGEDFFGKVMAGLSSLFEGASEEETMKKVREELKTVFACKDVSVFLQDPEHPPGPMDGDWCLIVKSGFGEGNRVTANDAKSLEDLKPGKPVKFSELYAEKAALKAIALAFEEDCFYGADIEKKIVLLKDPRPEDDLGSGDLSVLAIPLRYTQRVGRFTENAKVGVLALFNTPCRSELGDVEKAVSSTLAFALLRNRISLRDPVTNLYTEPQLRNELLREWNLWEITNGKIRGGMVVGWIDALAVYRQTLESQAHVDPRKVSQKLSDVLHGVGECVINRATNHTLDQNHIYKSGIPGRIGREGFAVILPLLKDFEMAAWSSRLAKDVLDRPFEGEQLLEAGDITASLRVIPFGAKGAASPEAVWKLAHSVLEELEREQARARKDVEELLKCVNTIRVWHDGKWLAIQEWRSVRAPA